MKHVLTFLATGCYSGYLPLAPGTWGSMVGVALYWGISGLPPLSYAAAAVAFIFLSIWAAEHARRIFGEEDPSRVVIDEIAGYLVAMAFHEPSLYIMIAAFIVFRIFDVIKPPPARWMERRLPGGIGIVMDDVMAGIYTNLALYALIFVAAKFGIYPLVK